MLGSIGLSPLGRSRKAAAASAFDPSLYGTVATWLKAGAITGKNDGDSMAGSNSWPDSAGSNHGTGYGTLTYRASAVNGLPAVEWGGSGDNYFDTPSVTFGTVFCVAVYPSATFSNWHGLVNGTVEGAQLLSAYSGQSNWFGTANIWVNGVETKACAPLANNWKLHAAQRGTTMTFAVRIGRDRQYTGRSWLGKVAEVLAYTGLLAQANRDAVQVALKTKYGIS